MVFSERARPFHSGRSLPVEDMKKAYELGAYINLDDATMVEFLERQ